MKKILCIFLFIPLTFTLIAQRYVSGYITDAENGNQPVVGASVFLSNTTIGDFTDAEGYYKLKIPEAGAYRLTISYVGYQSVFKEIEPGKTSLEFNTALHVSINELKEVTVTEKLRFRQRDIDLFWKTILGTSPSPKTIQVINPDKVYYYYNSKTGILKVTCREPLELNNYETGYHIHYVLDYFTYDYNKNIIDWSNQFNFTELKPENSKQESTWEKKRQEVYNLSLVKFIKSLYNNSLYDDGFVLATLSQDPSPNRSYQISLLNPESILSAKSADNGKTLNLSNQQVMLICYGRPVTANDLYMIQQTQSKGFYNGLVMNLLYGESIRIYPDGTYANKLQMAPVNISNTLLGLNMKLPINYHYEVIEFPAVENENTFDFDSIAKHFDAQMSVFPQEKLYLHTDRDFYAAGEKIWFKAYLTDAATLQPSINSRYVYVELINSRDSLINRVMIRPENDMFYGNLSISENVPEGDYTLRAYTRYMENLGDDYFFKKNIRIENLSSDKKQLFQTGQVNGREQNFKLPQSNPRAYTLTVSRQNKMLTVGVQKPAGSKNTPCYLLAQCRGEVFYFSAIQGIAGQARNDKVVQGIAGQARNDTMDQRVAGQAGNDVEFSEEELPAGVLQFVLFDEQMNPLSERLVFSKNYDCAKVEFHTNSETYKTRDHVIFSLSIVDSDGYPLAGNLSVAVTDDKDIAVDTTTTILSNLLLSSELKGYIENPACYLQDNPQSATALDSLMLTHEWRRYNIPEVVKGNYETPQIPFQTSQEISGKVKDGSRSKSLSDSELSFMVKGGGFGLAATDKKGAFTFKDFEYPDGTSYFIQALGKKGNNGVELVLNEDSFPPLIHAPQSSIVETPANKEETNAFIAKAEQRARYNEDMQTIQLGEVVAAGQKDELRLKYWANIGSDVTVRREDIEKIHPQYITDILRTIPGVRVFNGTVSIRESMSINSGTAPLVIIDGVEVGEAKEAVNSPLDAVGVQDVESIDIFRGSSASAFGVRGANGVISITTKVGLSDIRKGKSAGERKTLNQAIYTPLGYQTPVAFYSPDYETLDAAHLTPDYRTTIFWKPDIVVSDTGETSFDFYTSDFPTTYSVVIEGLTNDGKIVREVEKIRVE